MRRAILTSKSLAAAVLILFTAVLASEGFSQAAGQEQSEYQTAFQAGKKLYEDGEHKEAVIKFLQALTAAKEKGEIGDACFYLSLSYYGLGDAENSLFYMKKTFDAQPEREINARMFPSGYVIQFYRIKSDYTAQKPGQVEEKPTALPGKAEPEVKKKGKFPWLIVGGLAVAAGIVLYLVLAKKKDSGTNTGSISVTSTPLGAKVYLDGSDTGQITACTLANVAAGTHSIKLTKDGYADLQQSITVTAGQTANVSAALTKNVITVTSPASGATWMIGTTNDIRWSVDSGALAERQRTDAFSPDRQKRKRFAPQSDFPETADEAALQTAAAQAIVKVKIELYKSGTLHSLVIAEVDNTGAYSWPVPASLTDGTDYKIRVSCTTDSAVYGESGTFTISAGTIVINAPTAGSVWIRGSAYDIQWTSTASGNVRIELLKGTSSAGTIAADTPNDGIYNWTIATGFSDGTDYKIRISLVSNPTVFAESGMFTIFSGSIIVNEPAAGSTWGLGTTHDIRWTSTASGNVKIELYSGASSVLTISGDTANDGIESWTIPPSVTIGSNYKIRISLLAATSVFGESGIFQIGSVTSYEFVAKWGSLGSGDGQFDFPSSIAIDPGGNIYVTDMRNFRVQKFNSARDFLLKWGSRGNANGQFDQPQGLALDDLGWVFVSDNSQTFTNQSIQKFTPDGTFALKFGTWGPGAGSISHPGHLAVDKQGNVYTSNMASNRIEIFTTSGVYVAGWGDLGTGDGQLNWPQGIAVDNDGFVYVADGNNHRIQKFTAAGVFVAKWGSEGSGIGQFRTPLGLAVDQTGNVYVTEMGNRIQKFTSSGTFVTAWGSLGTGNGQVNTPQGIAVSRTGHVFVADTGNQRIQEFRPKTTAARGD